MTTLEYLKYRKKQRCKDKPTPKAINHDKLGQLLSKVSGIREKMEVQKPELMTSRPEDLDFIF